MSLENSAGATQLAYRILAMEDEAPLLRSLEEELDEVFPHARKSLFSTCADAVAFVEQQAAAGEPLDFAFLDIRLPDGLGTEVARSIKALYPKANILFCTAYNEYALEAFGIHVLGYLMKPVTARDICEVLDDMLPSWRTEKTISLPACLAGREPRVRVVFGVQPQVFIDGELVLFPRRKSLVLFGYLVEKRGEPVSTEQLAEVLWPEEPYSRKTKNKVTAAISSLRKILRDHGCEELLVKDWNSLSVDMTQVTTG
ncbi:MAG: response regulator [Coriobacteriales bacterium]